MMFMSCCRVTPSLAVRMTITSVVLGDGASEGGWPDGNSDCATAANGYAERVSGSKNFMDAPRISVLGHWFLAATAPVRKASPSALGRRGVLTVFTASIRALAVGSARSRVRVDAA